MCRIKCQSKTSDPQCGVLERAGVEECRSMLRDALREMILAYQQQGKETPLGNDLSGPLAFEIGFRNAKSDDEEWERSPSPLFRG
jgi:hypothetical protein